MRILLLAAIVLPLAAQTPAPAPDVLPAHWLGASGFYDPAQHPRWTGGLTMATYMGKGLYNYDTSEFGVVHGRLINSTRAGVALVNPLYEDKLYSVIFVNVGPVTNGTNVSFSAAGGGQLVYRFGKSGHYTYGAGFHVLNTGALAGLVNVAEASLGFTF